MTWPYEDGIDLDDWGFLLDYPDQASMPWAGTPGPAYSALGPPYGYSPYWNEDTRFPYTPAPWVGQTQPMGGQTRMVPQRASVMAPGPWSEIEPFGASRRGPSPWSPAPQWGSYGPHRPLMSDIEAQAQTIRRIVQPQAEAFQRAEAERWAEVPRPLSLQSAVGYQLGRQPPEFQPQPTWGPYYAASPYGSDVVDWDQGAAGYPVAGGMGAAGPSSWTVPMGAEGPGRFLTPQEIAAMTPEQRSAMAASDAQVQQQMAQYNQQAQGQQQFSQQVQQQTTPGSQGFDQGWWDEFTKVHGETPQEYYSRPQHERGAGGWQAAVARDASYGQQYMAMTGKTSLTDEDWRNIYYRVLPGGGGGGGGGGQVAAQPPPYQVPSMRYQGPQTALTMPSGALGTIGVAGRQAVEDILRGRGWSPSGVMGRYGYSEYTRDVPRRVWFQPKLFKPFYGKGGRKAEKLFRKLKWTPKKKKGR